MEKTFESEVLSRLAVIESKLDEQKETKDTAYRAYNNSKENAKDICELKERVRDIEEKPSKRWESIVTTIITGIAMAILGFILAKMGLN